ncbi:MAG: type II secretion system F family protein [Candidatus Micrarchaeia archaeon]
MIWEIVSRVSERFPGCGVRSRSVEKYGRLLKKPGGYVTMSLLTAFLCGIAAALALGGWTLVAMAGFCTAFSLAFFFMIDWPRRIERSRMARMEAEMPLVVRMLAMLLSMKIPFTRALEASADYGEAGAEIRTALEEAGRGTGLAKALAAVAERSESPVLKRVFAQVITAYESGGSEGVARLSQDLFSLQRYRMRDYVSKSSFFGLVFVVLTVVAPAMFLVLASVGALGAGMEISQGTFALVMVAGFPLLGALLLGAARSQMPPDVFSVGRGGNGAMITLLFAIALAAAIALPLGSVWKVAAVVVAGGGAAFAVAGKVAEDARIEKLEEGLPDSLLRVSGLPRGYRIDKIFGIMADAGDPLSPEAGKTLRQLRANVNPEKALAELWERNQSFMLRRMCDVMLKAHVSGASVSERMHELAEDLLEISELRRERENALSVQKYTLMLGALLVPVILTVSIDVLSKVGDAFGNANGGVLAIAPKATAIYVVLYAALTSFYIAEMEGKTSRMALYFGAMAGAALVGIYILSGQIP